MKGIQDLVRRYREVSGLSQRELANKVGVPQSTISRVEIGKGSMTLSTLNRICEVLGLEVTVQRKGASYLDNSLVQELSYTLGKQDLAQFFKYKLQELISDIEKQELHREDSYRHYIKKKDNQRDE